MAEIRSRQLTTQAQDSKLSEKNVKNYQINCAFTNTLHVPAGLLKIIGVSLKPRSLQLYTQREILENHCMDSGGAQRSYNP